MLDVGKRNSRSLPTATWKQAGGRKERVISPCALCAQPVQFGSGADDGAMYRLAWRLAARSGQRTKKIGISV